MNQEIIHNFNIIVSVGAVLIQILSLCLILILFFGPRKNKFLDFIDKHFLEIGFLLALSGTAFSLVYSEIIKFPACYLCWWARVFLYPQTIIFGLALWDKDRKVIKYVTPMLFLGFLLSAYHNIRYYFADVGDLPCDASGVSCYKQYVSEFGGYISIPMLSLTAILGILTVVVVAHFYGKRD